jgi:hypothetical protein
MTNRPQTPTQESLIVLRDLIFREGFNGWIVMMLILSIPIAFGITLSGFIAAAVDTFVQPFLTMLLGPFRSLMIPLGGVNDLKGMNVPNAIYLGDFLLETLRFIAKIGALFLLTKVLRGMADRAN